MAYNDPVTGVPDLNMPAPASRWESLLWPRWLPVRARLPLIAQITCAVAVTALVMGPWWASAPEEIPEAAPLAPVQVVPLASPVPQVPAVQKPKPFSADALPAHLNLDVRHSFGKVDFSVTIDGKTALETQLGGSGKRFRVFGKRAERGYTKTIELTPGVHLVKVRVFSREDKFDQTRVERFDLGSASVASMRIAADKSGLSLVAERPPAPAPAAVAAAAPPVETAPRAPPVVAPPAAAPVAVAQTAAAPAAPARQQEASTIINLLQSVRSMLIGIAGFVASTATAFMVQEFLRTRKGLIFAEQKAGAAPPARGERRRRRRMARQRFSSEEEEDGDDNGSVRTADSESSA